MPRRRENPTLAWRAAEAPGIQANDSSEGRSWRSFILVRAFITGNDAPILTSCAVAVLVMGWLLDY